MSALIPFLRKLQWKFSVKWYWYFLFRTENRNGIKLYHLEPQDKPFLPTGTGRWPCLPRGYIKGDHCFPDNIMSLPFYAVDHLFPTRRKRQPTRIYGYAYGPSTSTYTRKRCILNTRESPHLFRGETQLKTVLNKTSLKYRVYRRKDATDSSKNILIE